MKDGHAQLTLSRTLPRPFGLPSMSRFDSLTPASSPVRVTHLCRTASRWLHSQHAVLPLQICLRRAFIHIYVYPYMYLFDSMYPCLSAQRSEVTCQVSRACRLG